MTWEKAYYLGLDPSSFRNGEPAEIVGIAIVVPGIGYKPRPCFHLRWPDDVEDFATMEREHRFLSKKELSDIYTKRNRINAEHT